MFNIFKSLIFEIKSYFVQEPNPYIRLGECKKCGKCCNQVYSIDTYTQGEFKLMQLFYPPYRRFYIKETDPEGNFVFACKYVTPEGLCSVYEKRPNLCKRYPITKFNYPLKMPQGCGFRFEKKDFKEFLE